MNLRGKRIFVGPYDIAGFGSRIAICLANAGAKVLFLNAEVHLYNPQFEKSERLKKLFKGGFATASRLKTGGPLLRVAGLILAGCYKLLAFAVACVWTQTCVFIGGKGILTNSLEYLFLRLLGKQVIHIFIGTASRPRYLSGYAKDVFKDGAVDEKKLRRLARRTKRQARRIRAISRRASVVVENPLCGHFQEKPFVNYFKLGIPFDVAGLEKKIGSLPTDSKRQDEKIRILHCPSRPEIKGSSQIETAIKHLIDQGLPIDFRRLTGISHSQVLREIAQCDFVVDQLFSDTPMAGFAAEASALGKAAVVGGYGWKLIEKDLQEEEIPPTATCRPEEIESTIRQLINDSGLRGTIGKKSHDFLATQWSDEAFAARFAKIISGEIPCEWMIRPEQVRYAYGVGLEEGEARRIIGALIDRFGTASLRVNHSPQLKHQLVSFAKGNPVDY